MDLRTLSLPYHFHLCCFSLVHPESLIQSHPRRAKVLSYRQREEREHTRLNLNALIKLTYFHSSINTHKETVRHKPSEPRDAREPENGAAAAPRWFKSEVTFDVMNDCDYVLSEQLWGAAAQLSRLYVLENGTELLVILLCRVHQIVRQASLFG